MNQIKINVFVQGKRILWFKCYNCQTTFNEFQCPREKTESGMMINGKYVCEHKGERLKSPICPNCGATHSNQSHTGWLAPYT